mmetsp:Transcript_25416/g.53173  ORF Transcript_25416/g.53173 Transcript_25416/m.53173 type:complete len:266 (-) Transcript_25416:741-1538(-)
MRATLPPRPQVLGRRLVAEAVELAEAANGADCVDFLLGNGGRRRDRLADADHVEADGAQRRVVEHVAPVKHKCGLLHLGKNAKKVKPSKLVPLGQHKDGVRASRGVVGVGDALDQCLLPVGEAQAKRRRLARHARVVDAQLRALVEQRLAHVKGGRVARVVRVLLVGDTPHGQLLAAHRVEHGSHDRARETPLLVVVKREHVLPVVSNLRQPEGAAEVDEVADVRLVARAAEADRCCQILAANAAVDADGEGHLVNIGARALAQR